MKPNKAYKKANELIRKGRVDEFSQLKSCVPIGRLAKDIGTNTHRLNILFKSNVGRLTFGELETLTTLFKVDFDQMSTICMNQFFREKEPKEKQSE